MKSLGESNRYTPGLWLGMGMLLLLVGMSLYYWQARTLFSDAAFQSFSFIRSKGMAYQVQRYGAILVQGPGVLAVKAGLSLPTVLKVYSAAFTVYPLLFGCLLWRPLRAPRLALILILFFGLLQAHTFFWIQNELLQACLLGLLTVGIIQRKLQPAWYVLPLWYAMIALVVFAHPMSFAVLLFMLIYLGWEYRKQVGWAYWSTFLALGLVLLYKHHLAPIGTYDTRAFSLFDGFGERFPRLFELDSTRFFAKRLLSTYYLLLIAFVATLVALIRQRQWAPMVLMLGAVSTWLVIILTTYFFSKEQMYMESYYLPLTLFVGFPLVWHLWGNGPRYSWLLVMAIVIVVRLTQILEVSDRYLNRLTWLKDRHEQMQAFPDDQQRFYMNMADINSYLLIYDWAVPYEMLLLSSLEGPEYSQSLYLKPAEESLNKLATMKHFLPTPFGDVSYDGINYSGYFNLRDTTPVQLLPLE